MLEDTAVASADASEVTEPDPPVAPDKVRRGRGNLESDVKVICDKYASGDISLPEGEYLTPHRVAKLIVSELQEESKPSTGAVAACMRRWEDVGYIVVNERPFAFVDYTEAARTEGLAALKERAKQARKGGTSAPETPVSEPEHVESAPVSDTPETSPRGDIPDNPDNPDIPGIPPESGESDESARDAEPDPA